MSDLFFFHVGFCLITLAKGIDETMFFDNDFYDVFTSGLRVLLRS